jgi:TRAP-type mannitol/chloroaromatic compound transport system substrate-binding protein
MKKTVLSMSLALLVVTGLVAGSARAPDAAPKVFQWTLQAAVPAGDPHMGFLRELADNIAVMSQGQLKITPLPSGAIVPPGQIGDAVSRKVVDAGQFWTHYIIGKHPAAGLFSSPPGGAGTGLDQFSLRTWYNYGGGHDLHEKFFQRVGLNVVAFPYVPDGPEVLGWFPREIKTLDEFKKLRYRVSAGLAQDVYKEMGASPVAMAGAELMPALERGVLDAAEWINPATDIAMGFHDVLKHLSLDGLHQAVTIAMIVVNGDRWRELPEHLRRTVEVAIDAAYLRAEMHNLYRNAQAIRELVDKHGVNLFPAPPGYHEEFTAATERVMKRLAKDPFFKEVLESQLQFAETVVPYRTDGQNLLYYRMGRARLDAQEKK